MALLHEDGGHFRQFAGSLERAIARYGPVPRDELLALQKQQMDKLMALEEDFRKTIIRGCPEVYGDFVEYICETRRNILAARPYFRERQEVFTEEISGVLKARDAVALQRFHINYNFVRFALQGVEHKVEGYGQEELELCQVWQELHDLGEQIKAVRTEIGEMNAPLAINRARLFWSRTPRSHLSYMDMIQICYEGLMAGVDKYVGEFSRVFRGVLIGRMVGNLIEQYSETLIHFYPLDRRRIYRANKAVGRQHELNYEELARQVNEGLEPAQQTTASEIAELLAAASCVSSDAPVDDSEEDHKSSTVLSRAAAPEETRPDVLVEKADTFLALQQAISQLPLLEQKVLRLRGVSL